MGYWDYYRGPSGTLIFIGIYFLDVMHSSQVSGMCAVARRLRARPKGLGYLVV